MRYRTLILCLFLLLPGLSPLAEPRRTWSQGDPEWLRAVGRLEVPGYRTEDGERLHNRETCSATLVAPDRILTAWHCLEYYHDLSRPILFTLPASRDHPREARRLLSGGHLGEDWALLALDSPVRPGEAAPLTVATAAPDNFVSIAGYAKHSGAEGRLSWQARCAVTGATSCGTETRCSAYRGDSGGPAVSAGQVIGVISTGSSTGITFLVPTQGFASRLRPYLD